MGKSRYRVTYEIKGFLTPREFEIKAASAEEAVAKCKSMLGGVAKRSEIKNVERIEK